MRNIWMNCSYQGNLRTRARRTSSLGLFWSRSTWARVVSSSFWGKLKSRKRTAGRFPFSPGDDGALRSCLLSSISTVSRSVYKQVRSDVKFIFLLRNQSSTAIWPATQSSSNTTDWWRLAAWRRTQSTRMWRLSGRTLRTFTSSRRSGQVGKNHREHLSKTSIHTSIP